MNKEKLIDLVWDNYRSSGNPYLNESQLGEELGRRTVAEEIMEMLGMTWEEVKAHQIAEIKRVAAKNNVDISPSTLKFLEEQ